MALGVPVRETSSAGARFAGVAKESAAVMPRVRSAIENMAVGPG